MATQTIENQENFIIAGFNPSAIANFAVESGWKNGNCIVYVHKDVKAGVNLFTSNIDDAYVFTDEDEASNIGERFNRACEKSEFTHLQIGQLLQAPINEWFGVK